MAREARRPIKCLVFGASLRQASLNNRLASLAADVAEEQGAIVDRANMRDFDCPPYDADVEHADGLPGPARELCRRIKESDAFIISSPEYNASMPGHLKNAIDWASRPATGSPLRGKPAALMGASSGMSGTIRAQLSLRQCFVFTQTLVLPAPEVLIPRAAERFDSEGKMLTDESTRELIRKALRALVEWTQRVRTPQG